MSDSTSQRSKRPKTSHPSDDAATTACALSFEKFFLLPHELRSLIIHFACRLPASASPTVGQAATGGHTLLDDGGTAHGALPGLDPTTTLHLVRTSRSLYALVTPFVFSHVWLTRPSQLVSFQQAIAVRPQLGRLVNHLHVGPDSELPEWWFPLDESTSYYYEGECPEDVREDDRPPMTLITPTLRSQREAGLLPDGWHPRAMCPLRGSEGSQQSRAVSRTLRVAQRAVNVDLEQNGRDWKSKPISDVAWTQKVFEVQAIFELFLIKCAEVEREQAHRSDDEERYTRQITNYPSLILRGFPDPQDEAADAPASGEEIFVVTRSDVLRHLARPGAITDRFDHPLLFARSGWDSDTRATLTRLVDSEVEDFVDVFSSSQPRGRGSNASPRSPDVLDPSLLTAATLGSLTAQLRSVLSFTPFLENLSLTGFLERAVSGGRPATSLLKALRSVSLGPHPSCWLNSLRLESLGRVERLRVTRNGLCEREARDIAAYLPKLRELEWWVPARLLESESLLQSVNALIGRTEATDGHATGAAVTTGAPQGEVGVDEMTQAMPIAAEDSSIADVSHHIGTSTESSLPLITLRLHHLNVKFLLDSAPSAEARTAWQSGKAWDNGLRRLLLIENGPPGIVHHSSFGDFATDAVYEDGRKWWVKRGGLHGDV